MRGLFGSKPAFTAAQIGVLRQHVVNLRHGQFINSGEFSSSAAQVGELFSKHLKDALAAAQKQHRPLRILLWAHGGLVPEKDALTHVLEHKEGWLKAGIYPLYFVWETDIWTALGSLFGRTRGLQPTRGLGKAILDAKDAVLEMTLRGAGTAVWSAIKKFSELSSAPEGGAAFTAGLLGKFVADHKDAEIEIHACGHSAGAIFHSHFLPVLARTGVVVRDLFFLAPAITVRDFIDRLGGRIGRGKEISRSTMFTMTRAAERVDNVAKIYNQSLLYFVSRACEPLREEPLLGLDESLRESTEMRALWGLDDSAGAAGEIVFSPNREKDGISASNSTTHGGFDNDYTTLNSIARRISGDASLDVFKPELSRGGQTRSLGATGARGAAAATPLPLQVKIAVRYGSVVDVIASDRRPKIDFRSAGHYNDCEPEGAELALDCSLSEKKFPAAEERHELILTEMTRRGVLPGRLGCPVLLPHPHEKWHMALVILGVMGRLGPAELAVAVTELCLTLSRVGGRHLATVLIGSGQGTMEMDQAFCAWISGIRRAQRSPFFSLKQITFVENDAARFLTLYSGAPGMLKGADSKSWIPSEPDFDAALRREKQRLKTRLDHFKATLENESGTKAGSNRVTRIHIRHDSSKGYVFSAMTDSASVPERDIVVDKRLVDEFSVQLSQSQDPSEQRTWANALTQFLLPHDFREIIFNSAAHVVFSLDGITGHVPWEMLLRPDVSDDSEQAYLGTAEGFGVTRQLQTTFAPAPEPLGRTAQKLAALIIADPASDASLAGALAEAEAVADLLEREGVEVTMLLQENATRAAVVRALLNKQFDILHFAGHCFYDAENLAGSGWIFKMNPIECFTASELSRLDRIPAFVFANACESGITSDDPLLRQQAGPDLAIAPAFAESFFQRGVRNFICTGWAVNDDAALAFATTFYEHLLHGEEMHQAVRLARSAAFAADIATWGAYQHYGNPFFRLRNK